MSEAVSIKRRKSSELPHSFDTLRREGIKLAQQLSGDVWTDYNLHDPGVTILEQLAYAITDLIYRSDFEVQDYLVDDSGDIDFTRLALHAPEQIFPCRPTTLMDYRKSLMNGVSELDNVWLSAVDDEACRGLYQITVKLEQGLSEREKSAAIEKVRQCYSSNRNLCEDIAEITAEEGVDYQLCGQIEVSSGRRPADVLAEIYFESARRIAGGITLASYDQALHDGLSLEQLFSGPFTNHGLFRDEDLSDKRQTFLVSSLYSAINAIKAVDYIRGLYLEREGVAYYDSLASDSPQTAINLCIPNSEDEIKITLTSNGREVPVSIDELRAKFDEISFKYHSSRSTPQDMNLVYTLPQANTRPINAYASIQNQFPSNYGIGAFGLPESAPVTDKAKANQLKSYLVLFEQIMSNFLANLDGIKTLFSVDTETRNSYRFKLLDKQDVSGLRKIYPDKPAQAVQAIVNEFDDYLERKNRLLDYLLALYGESFAQHSLRHFNCYYKHNEVEAVILNNKVEYLKSIVEMGRDRVAAPDYAAGSWSQCAHSSLQQRVSMLLGFKNYAARALTMAILKQGIKLAKHSVYEQLKAGSDELEFIDIEQIEQGGFKPVSEIQISNDVSDLREQIGDAIPLKNNLLSDDLLRGGILLDRFRLGSLTSGQDYQLTYCSEDQRYWYLGTYAEREAGALAANALRQLLLHLNTESEGLHIIEHLLLRPVGQESHAGLSLPAGEDFYSFRISVIFPAWSACCFDPQFRLLAEETVRLNAPSHVYPEVYWLEFHKMYEFEMLYEKWMKLKATPDSDQGELNYYSMKLISFLLENRRQQEGA